MFLCLTLQSKAGDAQPFCVLIIIFIFLYFSRLALSLLPRNVLIVVVIFEENR